MPFTEVNGIFHLGSCGQFGRRLTWRAMLSSQLSITTEVMPMIGFDRLAAHLPYEWIAQALNAYGVASVRRRRLPAEQVVWLIIALALFRRQSMERAVTVGGRWHDVPGTGQSREPRALWRAALRQWQGG